MQKTLHVAWKATSKQVTRLWKVITRISKSFASSWLGWKPETKCIRRLGCFGNDEDDNDLEANGLPTSMPASKDHEKRASPDSAATGAIAFRPSDATAVMNEPSTPGSPLSPPTPINTPVESDFSISNPPTAVSAAATSTANSPPTANASTGPTLGKQLWRNAVRNVKMRNSALNPLTVGSASVAVMNKSMVRTPPIRKRTMSSTVSVSGPSSIGKRSLVGPAYTRSRVSELVPRLVELDATHDLAAHSALVRHMQFSPDGKYLATSR